MSDSYILKLERLRVELRDILRDKGFVLPDNVDLATLVSKVGGIGDYDLLKAMLSGQPYDIIDTEGVIEVITTTTLYYTGHLARIDLPEVKTVPQSVFKNQTGLTSVKVPKLTVIPSEFCNGCTNLSEVDISAATSIAANAFSNTKALKSITFPQTLTSIVNSFGGSGIEELDIPASTNIGTTQGNFSSCLSLKKVTINGLTNINKGTFNGCSIFNTLIIRYTGGVLTLIENSAFTGTPFRNSSDGGIIYVPDDLINSYQTASVWSTLEGATFKGLSELPS